MYAAHGGALVGCLWSIQRGGLHVIVYDLCCGTGHGFEGWFRSAEDFESQRDAACIACPLCQDTNVTRRPSASRLNLGSERGALPEHEHSDDDRQPVIDHLRNFVRDHVENVGCEFAVEVRKMHYGDAEERNIRGVATGKEVLSLHEEGIDAMPLPAVLTDKEKMN